MKKTFLIPIFLLVLSACSKEILPYVGLTSDLIDGPWQLISSTQNHNGYINRYIGTSSDSILYLYTFDMNSNILLTNIKSYINNTNSSYQYKINGSQGIPKPYDTIICSSPWKVGYSDTFFVSSFTDQLLVFKVNYTTTNYNGIEIDSLKKIRYY